MTQEKDNNSSSRVGVLQALVSLVTEVVVVGCAAAEL
jgi:hypothetical protein